MADITSNLVVYYPFNSDILDYATGSGVSNATNNGTTISNSIYKVGTGSLFVDNTNSLTKYITLNSSAANASDFPGTNGLTFSVWVKVNTPGESANTIFNFANGNALTNSIFLSTRTIPGISLVVYDLSGSSTFPDVAYSTIQDGNWHHIVWTLTNATPGSLTSTWVAYIDGTLISTLTSKLYPSTLARPNCFIGRLSGFGYSYYKGYIDDFRVYKRVLTQVDVTALYNAYNPNFNSTIYPFYFNGTISSYLNLGNDNSLYFGTSTFTIEWWQYHVWKNANNRSFSIGSFDFSPFTVIASAQTGFTSSPNLLFYHTGKTSMSGPIPSGTGSGVWGHCAITRDSTNTIRIFFNGTVIKDLSNNTTNYTNPGGSIFLSIGNENVPSVGSAWTGWMLGFTWTKGECLYTSNFTPPTSLPTVTANTVVQLYGLGTQLTAKGTYGSTLNMMDPSRNFNVVTGTPPSPNQYPAGFNNKGPETPVDIPCFHEDTRILSIHNGQEQYIPIKELRKGDYVKTVKHGYLPISMIGHRKMKNPGDKSRIKDRLYHLDPSYYPDLFEDLYITGCHSILVDELTIPQRKKTIEDMEDVYITDNYYRLMAYIDENAIPYQKEGDFTIYHFSLENEDYYGNYGVYANGLLVESTSNRYMKELSNMELIQ